MSMGEADAGGAAGEAPEPSGEECILAGIAHLAFLGGFWIVGPVVIYLWKRKASPFVAFHSVQAIFVSLLGMIAGTVGVIVFMSVYVGGAFMSAAGDNEVLAIVAFFGGLLLCGIITLTPAIIAVVAGYRAFKGRTWSIPFIGSLSRRILARDKPSGEASTG